MVTLRRGKRRTVVRVNRPPFMSFFNGVTTADNLLRTVEIAGKVDEFIGEPYTEGLVSRVREIGLFTAIRKSLTE